MSMTKLKVARMVESRAWFARNDAVAAFGRSEKAAEAAKAAWLSEAEMAEMAKAEWVAAASAAALAGKAAEEADEVWRQARIELEYAIDTTQPPPLAAGEGRCQ